MDWQRGKIPYFTLPHGNEKDENENDKNKEVLLYKLAWN